MPGEQGMAERLAAAGFRVIVSGKTLVRVDLSAFA
jgi:hypothetical protein